MNLYEREKKWLLEEKYHGQKTDDFFHDVKQLSEGEPLAFLIGNQPFLNCTIDLTYRPLIPRTETEFWVKGIADVIKDEEVHILDLFSGSGCIGISILTNCPNSTVAFGELNPDFIKQVKLNLALNNIDPERYEVRETDVFEHITKETLVEKFDYILTNPPYISKNGQSVVQKSVMDREDPGSLFAEDDGLFFVKKLIIESPDHLVKGGQLYIEFDPWQTEILTPLLENQKIWEWRYVKDQFGKDRVLKLTLL